MDSEKSDGPVGLPGVVCQCGSTDFEMRNYSMMWHDGDVYCAQCGKFIRSWDAG